MKKLIILIFLLVSNYSHSQNKVELLNKGNDRYNSEEFEQAETLYKEALDNDGDTNKVLDDAGITRYCCRRMFVGHIDLLDEVAPFSVAREDM